MAEGRTGSGGGRLVAANGGGGKEWGDGPFGEGNCFFCTSMSYLLSQPGYVVHVLCDGRNFFCTYLLSLSSDAAALEPGKVQSRRKEKRRNGTRTREEAAEGGREGCSCSRERRGWRGEPQMRNI